MIGAGGGGRTCMVFLPRDFKAYASKITIIQNHKNKGIFSRKPAKNAPKSMIILFYQFVTNSLKSATSQNFPIIFTKMSRILRLFLYYFRSLN